MVMIKDDNDFNIWVDSLLSALRACWACFFHFPFSTRFDVFRLDFSCFKLFLSCRKVNFYFRSIIIFLLPCCEFEIFSPIVDFRFYFHINRQVFFHQTEYYFFFSGGFVLRISFCLPLLFFPCAMEPWRRRKCFRMNGAVVLLLFIKPTFSSSQRFQSLRTVVALLLFNVIMMMSSCPLAVVSAGVLDDDVPREKAKMPKLKPRV